MSRHFRMWRTARAVFYKSVGAALRSYQSQNFQPGNQAKSGGMVE